MTRTAAARILGILALLLLAFGVFTSFQGHVASGGYAFSAAAVAGVVWMVVRRPPLKTPRD